MKLIFNQNEHQSQSKEYQAIKLELLDLSVRALEDKKMEDSLTSQILSMVKENDLLKIQLDSSNELFRDLDEQHQLLAFQLDVKLKEIEIVRSERNELQISFKELNTDKHNAYMHSFNTVEASVLQESDKLALEGGKTPSFDSQISAQKARDPICVSVGGTTASDFWLRDNELSCSKIKNVQMESKVTELQRGLVALRISHRELEDVKTYSIRTINDLKNQLVIKQLQNEEISTQLLVYVKVKCLKKPGEISVDEFQDNLDKISEINQFEVEELKKRLDSELKNKINNVNVAHEVILNERDRDISQLRNELESTTKECQLSLVVLERLELAASVSEKRLLQQQEDFKYQLESKETEVLELQKRLDEQINISIQTQSRLIQGQKANKNFVSSKQPEFTLESKKNILNATSAVHMGLIHIFKALNIDEHASINYLQNLTLETEIPLKKLVALNCAALERIIPAALAITNLNKAIELLNHELDESCAIISSLRPLTTRCRNEVIFLENEIVALRCEFNADFEDLSSQLQFSRSRCTELEGRSAGLETDLLTANGLRIEQEKLCMNLVERGNRDAQDSFKFKNNIVSKYLDYQKNMDLANEKLHDLNNSLSLKDKEIRKLNDVVNFNFNLSSIEFGRLQSAQLNVQALEIHLKASNAENKVAAASLKESKQALQLNQIQLIKKSETIQDLHGKLIEMHKNHNNTGIHSTKHDINLPLELLPSSDIKKVLNTAPTEFRVKAYSSPLAQSHMNSSPIRQTISSETNKNKICRCSKDRIQE